MVIKLLQCTVIMVLICLLTGCRESLIAFSSTRDGELDIFTVDMNGEKFTNLTKDTGDNYWPSWSPNGRKIVFSSERKQSKEEKEGTVEIYIINADGSNQKRLTYNKYADVSPVFSLNGDRIAYCSNWKTPVLFDIIIMNTDGTGQTKITDTNGSSAEYPNWLNNDTLIFEYVYVKNKKEKHNLFTINKDGSGLKKFIDSDYNDYCPVCSPDGTRVAFKRSDETGYTNLYVINTDGSNLHRLTSAYDVERPTWSPDNKQIAYSFWFKETWNNIVRHINIIDADGAHTHELMIPCPMEDSQPAWSPF